MSILTLFQPFSKISTFQHFYKSAFSVRWKEHIKIGMVGKKKYEVQVYNLVYNTIYTIYSI